MHPPLSSFSSLSPVSPRVYLELSQEHIRGRGRESSPSLQVQLLHHAVLDLGEGRKGGREGGREGEREEKWGKRALSFDAKASSCTQVSRKGEGRDTRRGARRKAWRRMWARREGEKGRKGRSERGRDGGREGTYQRRHPLQAQASEVARIEA